MFTGERIVCSNCGEICGNYEWRNGELVQVTVNGSVHQGFILCLACDKLPFLQLKKEVQLKLIENKGWDFDGLRTWCGIENAIDWVK